MNFPWVIRLAREDAGSLAGLRLLPRLEVAEAGTSLWLCGPPGDESLDLKIAALPAEERFELIGTKQLRLLNHRVPSGTLPTMSWQPLSDWLQVELPSPGLPGNQPSGISLRLLRSSIEHEPEILLTTLAEFEEFSTHAAQVRLDRLQFAADDQGRVLVRGTPLPPLPGKRFVLHGGVAVLAGFHWSPPVSVDVLCRRLGASNEALVLWHDDGTLTRFHAEQFVDATRSGVRQTAESMNHSR